MCGIIGYSCLNSRSKIELNLEAIAHRGPDDSGIFEDTKRGVALGHTRLSILDLSQFGHQPMLSADSQIALVFNGEIYNYQELRSELEMQDHQFNGQSDTEVLLHLYMAQLALSDVSEEAISLMLRKLNGIFAFAIWDAKLKILLVARDALGVKPLYYKVEDTGLYFASEIKALLPLTNTMDFTSLNRYLSYLWCPGNGTPSTQVRKLGPGEAMWIKEGSIQKTIKWYQLPVFRLSKTQNRLRSKMKASEAIQGTELNLRQAVHRQMVADVPVGAFLSGGLDSSSVVAFAREKNPDMRCFTIEAIGGDDAGVTGDLPYAKQVASHLKVPLDVVQIDASQMARDLPSMILQLDEPLADLAPLNVLYISRLAREQGIKVLLSGTGGDDLFTGYRRHHALMSENLWRWLPKPLLREVENFTKSLNQNRSLFRRLRKLFSGSLLEGDNRLVNYFRWVDQRDLISLYSAEFRAGIRDSRAEDPMLEFIAGLPRDTSSLERLLALEQRFFLTDHNLTYTDKMSMAVGVEVRVPFLDLDLVEFAAQIPNQYKQRGQEGKWVLKKAMESYLPHNVIYRPKTGFGVPIRRWMQVELRELLTDLLGEHSLRNRGLFDSSQVQRLIKDNDAGRIDASYTLLSLMCIELWCRKFIDTTNSSRPNRQRIVV